MTRLSQNSLKWIAVLVVIIGMKYAGDVEYRDVVISSISQELYNKILIDLGGSASEEEICTKYQEEKAKYDALGI